MNKAKGKCRGCGKDIIFAKNSDGKGIIPLDPRPAVYQVIEQPDGSAVAVRDKNYMVTHFATCPKASDFSGGKKSTDA